MMSSCFLTIRRSSQCILVLTEIKFDETFLISQFLMGDFSKPCRFDRNKHRGGVMVYIRDTIPSKILEKKIVAQTILNVFLQNLIPQNTSGYSEESIIRPLKMMSIILIILIKPLTLAATAERFWLLEISTQK